MNITKQKIFAICALYSLGYELQEIERLLKLPEAVETILKTQQLPERGSIQSPLCLADVWDGWLVIDVDILKEAYEKLPTSQQTYDYIEQQTGINKATFSGYLNGKKYPNMKNFKKLCLYFQIDPGTLLGLKITPTK